LIEFLFISLCRVLDVEEKAIMNMCFVCLQLLSFEQPWTLILDDELANSFIAPVTDDIKDDHQLTCKLLVYPAYVALSGI